MMEKHTLGQKRFWAAKPGANETLKFLRPPSLFFESLEKDLLT